MYHVSTWEKELNLEMECYTPHVEMIWIQIIKCIWKLCFSNHFHFEETNKLTHLVLIAPYGIMVQIMAS